MHKITPVLQKILFLFFLTLIISGCSNPVQVNETSTGKNQTFSKDSISYSPAEITVWQMFRDPTNYFEIIYIAVQRDAGNFSTLDSIRTEAKDTLYCVGFEIEWNTSRHIYTLNKSIYRNSGWTSLDLVCSRKYTLTRFN